MTRKLLVEVPKRLHRYAALIIAITTPILLIIEIIRVQAGPGTPLVVGGSFVLMLWAFWLLRQERPEALLLVLATISFVGLLALIEAWSGYVVSAFDFTTAFGLAMILGVLAGVLSRGRYLFLLIAAAVAFWSVVMGALLDHRTEVIAVRAVVALVGVASSTLLISMLYRQLRRFIEGHDRTGRLQEALAACSEALLVQTDDAAAEEEAVRALLVATQADYVYLDRNIEVDDQTGWEIVADSWREGFDQKSGWNRGLYEESSSMFQTLRARRPVVVYTNELTGRERVSYENDGILGELIAPIFVGGVFSGSIGFVDYTQKREWTDDEARVLLRASDMFAAYWRRLEAQAELQALNESKDQLLAAVSHEIRTPLAAILGFSEEILDGRGTLSEAELDELSRIIASQSREMADLIEDLLTASRAESGHLTVKLGSVDLRGEVDSVIDAISSSHRTGKTIAAEGSGVHAWADPLRCRQMIRNLVNNAIRYGGDRIRVIVEESADMAVVVVADNGDGVDPAEAELIFDRFYRSRQSPTQPGSVGIGLSLSRHLAEMLGGTLRYVGAPGETRFELRLPRVSADPGGTVQPLASTAKRVS